MGAITNETILYTDKGEKRYVISYKDGVNEIYDMNTGRSVVIPTRIFTHRVKKMIGYIGGCKHMLMEDAIKNIYWLSL